MAFVISAGRPDNVAKMTGLCAPVPLTWVVPTDQMKNYMMAGVHPSRVMPDHGGLLEARNIAADVAQAQGAFCLQLSDDMRALRYGETNVNKERHEVNLPWVIRYMRRAMNDNAAPFAGVAPTDNAYFMRGEFSKHLFVVGDFMLIAPENPLRFDTNLQLKEDYDYTLQNLTAYGIALRCNRVLVSFQHRTNAGGAVAIRTPAVEEESIRYLQNKWPGAILRNKKRENEVLLRWKERP